MENCKICSEKNYYKINFNNLYLRTDSYNKNLHIYESRVCANCGVVYQFPQIAPEKIAEYYKNDMRKTKFPIYFDKENFIDFPLHFEQTGISFQRFYLFYKIIEEQKKNYEDLKLDNKVTVLDYGAYQGAFLYGCKKMWNVNTIAYDYNEDGLNFAKDFLKIDNTYIAKKTDEDTFNQKIDICTAIQVLEHIFDPEKFLNHIKKNVLKNKGYIYIEVPSALSSEFSNPGHVFTHTKESIKYLFENCGYKIIHLSEEHIYNYKRIPTLKRHVQTMIHCLAVCQENDASDYNKKINIGKKIYEEINTFHFKNSNKIFIISLKKFIKDFIKISYFGIFISIGYISRKLSFNLFNFSNNIFKKIPIIKDIRRK